MSLGQKRRIRNYWTSLACFSVSMSGCEAFPGLFFLPNVVDVSAAHLSALREHARLEQRSNGDEFLHTIVNSGDDRRCTI